MAIQAFTSTYLQKPITHDVIEYLLYCHPIYIPLLDMGLGLSLLRKRRLAMSPSLFECVGSLFSLTIFSFFFFPVKHAAAADLIVKEFAQGKAAIIPISADKQ